jgi:hypothetical protein
METIMINLIAKASSYIRSWLNGMQLKQVFAVVLTGFILLTSNAGFGRNIQSLDKRVDDTAHQIDSERPKTTREWNREARETADSPGERLENIADETGEALKEFGSMYGDTAKRTTRELKDQTAR